MNQITSRLASVGLALAAVSVACADPTAVQTAVARPAISTASGPPPFVFPAGCCYYNGQVVRTVVPPAATPQEGIDNFYGFPAAAAGQLGVAGAAPGASGYHGGHWKFHAVTWNVTPYLLTSEAAVLSAAAVGDVTVTRVPENDFKCPIQP